MEVSFRVTPNGKQEKIRDIFFYGRDYKMQRTWQSYEEKETAEDGICWGEHSEQAVAHMMDGQCSFRDLEKMWYGFTHPNINTSYWGWFEGACKRIV